MKDKKKISILILGCIIIIILGFTLTKVFNNPKEENNEAINFKKEYENLNGKRIENSDNTYKSLNIDSNNPFIYAKFDEIMEVLDDTGIIYFGFPECPWCRNAVPVLIEAAEEVGIDKIYYFNNLNTRDSKHLDDDGNIITDKEGTDEYYQLLNKLGEFSSEYNGLNDPSIRRIYFPTVIFVKYGKIYKAHISTVESQTDPYVDMTKEQKEELKNIYIENMEKLISCDASC